MTTVVEMLERLAQAGGKDKFAEIMSGFKTGLRNNNEMMRSIRNIEEITKVRMKRITRVTKRRR